MSPNLNAQIDAERVRSDISRRAASLRADAADDDRKAAEKAESNPLAAEYYGRRANWRRRLANDLDGGAGQ